MTVDLKQDTLSLASMRFTRMGRTTSACLADASFLSRHLVLLSCDGKTPNVGSSTRRAYWRAIDILPHTNQLLRPRVGRRLELKLQAAQSIPLKSPDSVSTSPRPACTDDGTCRLGHRVNRSSTSAKASHNPSAPIACCWPRPVRHGARHGHLGGSI